MRARSTLYERCQGPGALSLGALIEKADNRVAQLQEQYGDEFLALADHIERLAGAAFVKPHAAPRRELLLAAILDGASSAATAGYASLSAIATHLHECLSRLGWEGAELRPFIDLHLHAMRGAAKARAADWSPVLEELRQAASVLEERLKPSPA